MENILVLGSKPNADIPNIEFSQIYVANSALMRLKEVYEAGAYTEDVKIHSVVASGLLKHEELGQLIVECRPDSVVARGEDFILESLFRNELPGSELHNLTLKDQWDFQKSIFGDELVKAEVFHEKGLYKKIKLALSIYKNKCALGVSTGSFALLKAITDSPQSNIHVCGIGLQQGPHINSYGRFGRRALVDSYIMPNLLNYVDVNIYTTDQFFAEKVGVKFYRGPISRSSNEE